MSLQERKKQIKPFLKWAGGKYRLLGTVLQELPKGKRLVEPFAGSAAVYLNANFDAALVCDINSDLISLYKMLQTEGQSFIQYCQSFFTAQNNTKDKFYGLREQFNLTTNTAEKNAIFLYLNRHAYNGLVRYNSKGKFNVPFGQYKKPYFPLDELCKFHQKSNEIPTEFAVKDFKSTFAELKKGDVVYCDPPYAPLSATANFTTYTGTVFGSKEQQDLASLAYSAKLNGVPVVLSNHDTEAMRAIYADSEIKKFNVQRLISCNGKKRGMAPELLAIYK